MAESKRKMNNLTLRIISAIILVGIVIGTLAAGNVWFTALMGVAAVLLLVEWLPLVASRNIVWSIGGAFYIAPACIALAILPIIEIEGYTPLYQLLFLLAVVIATDTGAYFAGKTIGGKKLCPSISPGKTWAGLIGGMASAGITAALLADHVVCPDTRLHAFILGMIIAVLAQGGDLFESWLKRQAGVKDSGKLIPGHGGVFDRMDGLMLTAPLYAALILKHSGAL